MPQYRDLSLVQGIPVTLDFSFNDETGLPYDLTTSSVKFEAFNSLDVLVLTKTVDHSASISLTAADTLKLTQANHAYRVVVIDTVSTTPKLEAFRGFAAVDTPMFSSAATEGSGSITLPDGTQYPTSATQITPGSWYAIATYSRILVTGACTLTLDGKDMSGNITGNLATFIGNSDSQATWLPMFGSSTSFRINVVTGNPRIDYLP